MDMEKSYQKEGIMSVQDYMSALKLGRKEYHACVNKGKYPYLPVMENMMSDEDIDSEVSLGEDQIPLRLVVGTCTAGRTNAFANNWMPILDWGTEFAAKWASLSDSQVNEGIRESIKVYEYMNKFYVLEGNKRVSVLKYFKAVTVNAQVIRKVPKKTDDPDVKIYYEFMDFYKATKLNDIYFSKEGSFTTLMELVGIKPGEVMKEDDKKDLVSCYLNFRNAYEARGGDKFDFPVGDSFLRFIHIHGYDSVKSMSIDDMNKNVAKTWAEFELLDENEEVDLKMDPSAIEPAKKNILSYLIPGAGTNNNKKLKVGFIYENTPQTSEWCYAHELGRQYIDEIFGSQINTVSIANVKPEEEDYDAIQRLIDEDTDLIFVTSPSMMYASLKQAIKNPKAKILNCSLNISHKYIRTYYARMYEAKFLSGVIAGSMADSDRIGYIAGYPLYGVFANINAFAMGARFVNPNAKIYVEWSGIKDNDIEAHFKENGIKCISSQDMITPKNTSRKFGLYIDGDSPQHLAMTIWHWGAFYEKLIQSILSGSWNKDEENAKASALNYWWGMSSGAIDLIYSNNLPIETRRLVELLKKNIVSGDFKPFADEMKDQNGVIRNDNGHELEPDDIITMDWMLDNVIGKIPEYDELLDSYKLLVHNQGVIDINE